MMMGQPKINLHQSILTGMSGLGQSSRTGHKVHDYTHHQSDLDYIIETAEQPNQFYMTGQGKGVQVGDRILLLQNQQPRSYIVKKIDYYANPSDMWIALLEEKHG